MDRAALSCPGVTVWFERYSLQEDLNTCWTFRLFIVPASYPVQGAESAAGGRCGKVDIKNGRVEGLVAHEFFDHKEVRTILIQVGPESMPEGMRGKTPFPAKQLRVFMDPVVDGKSGKRFVFTALLREQISFRTAALIPILCKDIEGVPGKDGISVRAVFAVADMDTHVFAFNVFIPEMADFTYPESGTIKKGNDRFEFQIFNSRKEQRHFFLRRHIGKINVEFPGWKLGRIPGPVKDVNKEEPDLGDNSIDRPVREFPVSLYKDGKGPEVVVISVSGILIKESAAEIKESRDIGAVRYDSMVGKISKGDHLPELI